MLATTTAVGTTVLEPGKLEEIGLNGCWDEDFTQVLNHLSPEAGAITFMDLKMVKISDHFEN